MKIKQICLLFLTIILLYSVPCYADMWMPSYQYDLGPFRVFNSYSMDDVIDRIFIKTPKWLYNIYSENEYNKEVEKSESFRDTYPTYDEWIENAPSYQVTSYLEFDANIKQIMIWVTTYVGLLVFWIAVILTINRRIKNKKLEENNGNIYYIEPNKHKSKKNQYFNDED